MKEEKFVCPICGEPTNVYMGNARKDRLCRKHGQMAKTGEIVQCPDCGKWNEKDVVCDCKEENQKNTQENELTCLICGGASNGKHFCLECWKTYKDRSVDIRLKNLKFDCILDDYGNLKFKCDDGRHVRSLQEQSIANTLWKLEIQYVYEEEINYINENEEFKTIKPDFYLPKYDLYIEHIGFNNKKHNKIIEYKKKIYEDQNKKVLFTTPENLTDFKQFIKRELKIN